MEKLAQNLPKNRIPKLNYIAYCNKYLMDWIYKLGLNEFHFQLHYEREGENLYKNNHIGYNEPNDIYVIEFKYPANKDLLIHELGHLYLAKELNDFTLVGFDLSNIPNRIDYENYFSIILDCFVDYRLCKFGDFYDLWIELIEYQVRSTKQLSDLPSITYLSRYFLYYMELNFILKNELKLKLKQHVKRFLKDLRDNAIISSKKENKKLCYQDFQKIDRTLNHFDKIKNTTNSKDIYAFFDSVMAIIK